MTSASVTHLDEQGKTQRIYPIRVNEPDANFKVAGGPRATAFYQSLPDREKDLLSIACTVFAADSSIRRGTLIRSDLGAEWRRILHFAIPVCDLNFWSRNDVRTALIAAIEFMTEDKVSFFFTQEREPAPPAQRVLDLDVLGQKTADDVVLFSGGLDSLAGAVELLETGTSKLLLLTHFSAPQRQKYPRELYRALRLKYPKRITWLPVDAHLQGAQAVETTQRSRSFLFGTLGMLACSFSRADRLRFYENGIVSSNLPISSQVLGTMASRTTHPKSLRLLETLLNLVAEKPIELINDYFWKTKAEVVASISRHGAAALIRRTISCSHVRDAFPGSPHCGACSQCVDRRFGILGANLGDHDYEHAYATEVLRDPRPDERSRVLAVDWVKHALALHDMDSGQIFGKFGREFSRLADGFDGQPSATVLRRLIDLHKRHGKIVNDVITKATAQYNASIVDRSLPESSLLRMILGDRLSPRGSVVPQANPLFSEEHDLTHDDKIFPLRVTLSGSESTTMIDVRNLVSVRGLDATPVIALLPHLLEDRLGGLAYDDHRFMNSSDIARSLKVGKPATRRRIARLRTKLAEFYRASFADEPADFLLVHSVDLSRGRHFFERPEYEPPPQQ